MAKREGQTEAAEAEDTPDEYQFPVVMDWGEFAFKALTVRDMIRLRPRIREHWGGPLPTNVTPDGLSDLNSVEYALAAGLAEMELAGLTIPAGWDWAALRDPDRLWDLWLAYQKARDTFRTSLGTF